MRPISISRGLKNVIIKTHVCMHLPFTVQFCCQTKYQATLTHTFTLFICFPFISFFSRSCHSATCAQTLSTTNYLCVSFRSPRFMSPWRRIAQRIATLAGHTFLHTKMALEIVGRRKNTCAYDGPRHRHLFRNRKKAKEKATS